MPIPVRSMPLARRAFLAFAVLLTPLLLAAPAAATPAENFVNDNIQKGLEILRDKKLTTVQRRDQFKALLLGLVDTRRIAVYTLGQYRNSASPADVDAFAGAFQNYAAAAYQTDFIVHTQLIDPGSSQPPANVAFRVRTDAGKMVVVDVAYEGIWLSIQQRDQFVSFLGQNNGNVRTLIAHLSDLAVNLGKPAN